MAGIQNERSWIEMGWPEAITLEGNWIRLEPLRPDHASQLAEAAADGNLSELWFTTVPNPKDMARAIEDRLARYRTGTWTPFAVVDKASGEAVGMTSYLNPAPQAPRVEIGGTWYRQSLQSSGINVDAKLLLLEHAFVALRCLAVEFRTHRMNQRSRRAIEALGAQLDGILRNHFDGSGNPRDTCVYSIVNHEWPMVERHLRYRLQDYRRALSRPTHDVA